VLLPPLPPPHTGLSWSDVLLGPLPNVYLYAANNPSESIIAKRRGYGTIVSHNVPPYGRAGGARIMCVCLLVCSSFVRCMSACGIGMLQCQPQRAAIRASRWRTL
jgi:hypothetical protein